MSNFSSNRLKGDRYINSLTDFGFKWLFLLKHLPDLQEPPLPLQENVFMQLFEVARITSFSQLGREAYENSLKYYRDMNGVIETAREKGMRSLLLKVLSRKLGTIPDGTKVLLHQISTARLDALS